jgi:hypothetical protein
MKLYQVLCIQYAQYQRFATEEFVLQSGGVLCPQPGCGMGILVDGGCTKVACVNGCGVRQHTYFSYADVINFFSVCIL